MENKKGLVWIRDDFRISRNNALVYASENHNQVSAVYIFNPEEYENKREAQRWWIYHSLVNFKQEEILIETIKTNCRKTIKEKTGKRPYTNVNLVRI